jgi:hypothetical protein
VRRLPLPPRERVIVMPRMLVSGLLGALFGWLNPDQHRQYKRLREENRRLRRALSESDLRGEHPGEEDHAQHPPNS